MSDRFYGLYRGICYDTADPENRSRIRAKVPQVLGDVPTGWAWPCLPVGARDDGLAAIGTPVDASVRMAPPINSGVWVMFEGGNVDYPVWIGIF